MSLVICPECQKEVSDTSKTCPNCGFNLQKEKNKNLFVKNKKVLIVAGIVLVVIFAVFLFITNNLSSDEKTALRDCRTLKKLCKDPSSFALESDVVIYNDDKMGQFVYFVYSATNSFNARSSDIAVFLNGEYLGDYDDDKEDIGSQDQIDKWVWGCLDYWSIKNSEKALAKAIFVDKGRIEKKIK